MIFFRILIYYKIIFTFDRKNIKYEWFNWYLIIMNLEELKNKLITWKKKDNENLKTRWLTKNEYIFLEYLKRKDLNIFLFDWEDLNKFFENNKDFKKKSIITNLLKKKYLSNIWKWIYIVNWTWIDFDQLILMYLKKVSQKKKKKLKYYFWWLILANRFNLTEQIWNSYIVYNNVLTWIRKINWKSIVFKKIDNHFDIFTRKWIKFSTIEQTIIDCIDSSEYIQWEYNNLIQILEKNQDIDIKKIIDLYSLNNKKSWLKRFLYLLSFTSKSNTIDIPFDMKFRKKITLSKKKMLYDNTII